MAQSVPSLTLLLSSATSCSVNHGKGVKSGWSPPNGLHLYPPRFQLLIHNAQGMKGKGANSWGTYFFFCIFGFIETGVSLCSSGCPRTHYVYQAGLDLTGVGIKGTLEPALSLCSNVVFSICVYVCICARGQKGASHAPLWS